MSIWQGSVELRRVLSRFGLRHMLRLRNSYSAAWSQLFRGYFATHAMHALLNVGLIDEFERHGKVDIESFAKREEMEPLVLIPLCEALYAAGFLERSSPKEYSLHRDSRQIPHTMRGWIEVSYGYSEIFESLEALIRRQKEYGKDFYRRSDYVARGSGEMEKWLFFPMAVDLISAKGYKHLLDLGCGDGTFLRYACRQMPDLSGSGIDLAPAAIDEGRRKARESGLESRIHLLADDIGNIERAPAQMGRIDVATAFFVLHELLYFGKDVLLRFLSNFRRLYPDIPLMVFEVVRPDVEEMRRRPGLAIYYFLYHDLSQQKPVGLDTWQELFREAGFTRIQQQYLPFVRSVIYTLD